ncbi:MAG: transglycosylase SLT domain-containing protein [Proteobacteria bacterium]|nr:transglycosylase SLT domain-containing protein [Pseudomonadota bacterium]
MSPRRAGARILMTLAASAFLAACASQPAKPLPQPATVIAHPETPPNTLEPIAPVQPEAASWTSITASFTMDDCGDSALVRTREAMFTRSPAHFEQLLKQSLPLMMYVHKQLQLAGIPGEFTMLPLLESSYSPHEPSRRRDAAGMWQFMPRTATLHGIVVDREYDGRLDPVASTRAAIRMLTALDKQFGDWRLVDMAYNAGPGAITRALRGRTDVGDDVIPDIPVSATTRNHLAKLMALSCILREPQRFRVELPQPSADDQLATIKVPAGTRLAAAAEMAEIPEAKLRALNPGYRGATIPASSPRTLLLPAGAVDSLAAALTVDASESLAQVNTPQGGFGPNGNLPLPAEPTLPQSDAVTTPSAPAHTQRHRVRKGEDLWSIARRYHTSVAQLKRWNQLHDDTVHPGEMLRIPG